jgi:hypothetical protein
VVDGEDGFTVRFEAINVGLRHQQPFLYFKTAYARRRPFGSLSLPASRREISPDKAVILLLLSKSRLKIW